MMRKLAYLIFVVIVCAAPARAGLIITFYSHTLGTYHMNVAFPHGFVTIKGTMEGGDPVDTNFGFTAPTVSPAMLWGPVEGKLDIEPDDYLAQGKPHFSFAISDDQYRAIWAVAEKWRTYPQPSYDLETRNCVTFVKEIAVAAGLSVSNDRKFIYKPSEFLDDVAARNAERLARPGNRVFKPTQAPNASVSPN